MGLKTWLAGTPVKKYDTHVTIYWRCAEQRNFKDKTLWVVVHWRVGVGNWMLQTKMDFPWLTETEEVRRATLVYIDLKCVAGDVERGSVTWV